MTKFQKRPIVIEAVQFDGTLTSIESMDIPEVSQELGSRTVQIPTLEGVMTASPGDWIIKGVKGEFYPCKDDIFRASYEQPEPAGDSCHCPEHGEWIAADDVNRMVKEISDAMYPGTGARAPKLCDIVTDVINTIEKARRFEPIYRAIEAIEAVDEMPITSAAATLLLEACHRIGAGSLNLTFEGTYGEDGQDHGDWRLRVERIRAPKDASS